ncbi:hypothetical protein ES703_86656 [subsurface metagenome]
MPNTFEQIHFTARVLGPTAAYRLEKREVTQTLRSGHESTTESILNGRVGTGDQLRVLLDSMLVGQAELVSMDAVNWECLGIDDAWRGGFDTLAELEIALRGAGFRFKPLKEYELYRIQFSWLEEVHA